jgi:hypothetical protein
MSRLEHEYDSWHHPSAGRRRSSCLVRRKPFTLRRFPLLPLSARDLIAVQQRLGPAEPDTTAV